MLGKGVVYIDPTLYDDDIQLLRDIGVDPLDIAWCGYGRYPIDGVKRKANEKDELQSWMGYYRHRITDKFYRILLPEGYTIENDRVKRVKSE